MKRIAILTTTVLIVLTLSGMSHGTSRWEIEGITISPQVLILDYAGTRITVHTNIPVRDVIGSSVYIDIDGSGTLTPCSLFADNLGFLVAKFPVEEVRPLVQPPRAYMTLRGVYVGGGEFSADGSVIVR